MAQPTVRSTGSSSLRPWRLGLRALLKRDTRGAVLCRRMLPAAVGVPAVVGFLGLAGERVGLFEATFGVALFALTLIAVFVGLIAWTAHTIDETDEERRQAVESLRRAKRELRERDALLTRAKPKAADRAPVERSPLGRGIGRVLVAEDSIANQKVAERMLEKRGYAVEVVPNGRRALEALAEGDFAIVLMDCHMPEMDGYTATEEIRRREQGGYRVPVIAMTASAMEGDRERCLAAGMDDYLSKPLEPVHVHAVLEYWIGLPDEVPAPAWVEKRSAVARSAPVGLSVDLVGLYLRDAPGRVEAIERAVASADAPALREAARALRGSSRTLGAARMAELCTELEQIGAAGSVGGAAQLVDQLKRGFALTRRALERERPASGRDA